MRLAACVLVMWLLCPLASLAQTIDADAYIAPYEVEARVLQFQEELNELYIRSNQRLDFDYDAPMSAGLMQSISESIDSMEDSLHSFSTRWNTYQQGLQTYIATDEVLLDRVSEVQKLEQLVSQSIEGLRQQFNQMSAFNSAEVFVFGQDSAYSSLYRQAMSLSLSSKLQAQLEKVKAAEQLLFANVQKNYDEAKQTAENFVQLEGRMEKLESKYVELKVVSGKIQQAVYKPFIQRIKDELMVTAAVVVVMMFANMLITRLKAAKKTADQMKKMKNMVGGGGQEYYPTI
ncbi:MAG: hypothetical protein J6U14_10775 [Bacteroidaceae bacterium]|nr:hypothetical protein [Bacteroidaceae bacterium]